MTSSPVLAERSDAAASGGADVAIAALTKRYGDFHAVDDVSLTAGAGEFLALLGPSGSGKTTLLMAIAGFEMPDAGEISIAGQGVTELPANRRGIGVVFQNYALFPHMSVRDNIAFPLRRRGVAKAEIVERVEAAIRLVRLDGHGGKLPSALSGGQQQRVAIARATVFRPHLLLMDEPLGALDRRLREDMQFEIKELQRRLGVTIIYVTHDQEEAVMMADRIAVMRAGRIEQIGTAEDLYDRPGNAFVADFIGQTNLIEGSVRIRSGAGVTVALADGQEVTLAAGGDARFEPGSAVKIALRPERLSFAGPDEPAIAGRVRESLYAGGTRLFLVEIAPGLVIKARLTSRLDTPGPRPGEPVRLAFDPAYARIYPA